MSWVRGGLLAVSCGLAMACPKPTPMMKQAQKLLERQGPRPGDVVLECTPLDASVTLDGVPQGLCSDFAGHPYGLALGSGVRQVRVTQKGYLPFVTALEPSGGIFRLTVLLTPRVGSAAP